MLGAQDWPGKLPNETGCLRCIRHTEPIQYPSISSMSSPTTPTLAIVGPGRVGRALGRRWMEAGVGVGFVGRSGSSAVDAADFTGGRILAREDLAGARVVVLTVQDDGLRRVAEELAGIAKSGVWLHCSGAHDLAVLEPLTRSGASIGSLHPVCPVPEAHIGYRNLDGSPGVIQVRTGDAETAEVLRSLALSAGLIPVVVEGGDRLLYHTACVLAASGLTALVAVVDELLKQAMPGHSADELGSALMGGALTLCREHGALAALSGPVPRGDTELVRRQMAALDGLDPEAAEIFRALMRRATTMVECRGTLSDEVLVEMRGVLEGHA